jgi:putative oxidoreductase
MLMTHGLMKLTALLGDEPVKFADPIGVGAVPSLILAIFAEVVCPFLIILGIATRFATIPIIVTMLVAVFNIHSADTFDVKELPMLYFVSFMIFFATGAGKFSVDYLIKSRKWSVNY